MWSDFLAPFGIPFWIVCFASVFLAIRCFIYIGEECIPMAFAIGSLPLVAAVALIYLFGTTAVFDWIHTKDSSMFQIFAIGSWCFYLLMAVELLGLVYCMRTRRGITAAISIFATLLLVQVFGGIPIAQLLWANPLLALIYFVSYFVVGGGVWALWRWNQFVVRAKRAYGERREEFLKSKGFDPKGEFPEELWPEFKKAGSNLGIEFFPDYKKHKSEILGWIVAWPLSMIEAFVLDFLLNLADWVYRKLSGTLVSIMLFHWKQYDGDLELDNRLKKK